MTNIPFGKHKDDDIEDIPTSYLRWFLEKVDPPADVEKRQEHLDLCSEIEDELASREKQGEN